ncbi:hypothetical protein FHX82_000454 [Amycolatopsis bartoniae]|uniref:Uncharacterized protein n=1 Tax=Amycolatopsis bartoniae TaxID=941986 RepID=A0A8H9M5U0_9PSEU|nr:IniB N-terminal domain-containing protein [Amycolatopsis bartoniae]MBB2933434.1 hypothetical protein [Amycolatopsis bartoniae]TVT06603.1 hypothetical protein FNH07_19275 [Amycolatopsis bartoniae]GHF59416.1 hypothetical protein GCM10017566_36200 [Amycolatopsis bartoniae]
MSHPAQTLHDFVLTLLTDDSARSAFSTDPTAALERAGLGDVTPQDIQEVAPLVADYAPVPAADALQSVISSLPTGNTEGLQGAIAQLSAVADAANALPELAPEQRGLPLSAPTVSGLPVTLPAVGDGLPTLPELGGEGERSLPVSAPELSGLPVALPDLGDGLPALPALGDGLPALPNLGDGLPALGEGLPALGEGLPALPNLGEGLPAAPELGTTLPLGTPDLSHGMPLIGDLPLNELPVSGLAHEATKFDGLPVDTDEIDGLNTPSVNGVPVSAPQLDLPGVGTVQTATSSTTDGFAGSAAYAGEQGAAAAGATAARDGVGLAGAADSQFGTVAGSGAAGTDAVAGGLESEGPLGAYSVVADGIPAGVPSFDSVGDLGRSLDEDALAKSAPAAGTLADYVSSGGQLVGEHVAGGTSTLGGYLTGVDGTVGQAVTATGAEASTQVTNGAESLSTQAPHLPVETPALPAPALPTEVPSHLPADLPVHVSAELPQSLPHLPVANPLPQAGDLEHAISSQPLSDSVDVSHNPVSDATHVLDHSVLSEAPGLGGLTDDLPFGH